MTEHDHLYELPGEEYVLDLIAAREVPPAFPARPSAALHSGRECDVLLIFFIYIQLFWNLTNFFEAST